MKKLALCLVLMFAILFANSQVASISDGTPFSFFRVSAVNIDSVHPWMSWEVTKDSSCLEVMLKNIIVGSVKMQIYGELVDSFFRPRLAWLDGYDGQFPADFHVGALSEKGHINISKVCGSAQFQVFFSNILYRVMLKDNWEIVKRRTFRNPADEKELVSIHYTVQESGKFFFPQGGNLLTMWR